MLTLSKKINFGTEKRDRSSVHFPSHLSKMDLGKKTTYALKMLKDRIRQNLPWTCSTPLQVIYRLHMMINKSRFAIPSGTKFISPTCYQYIDQCKPGNTIGAGSVPQGTGWYMLCTRQFLLFYFFSLFRIFPKLGMCRQTLYTPIQHWSQPWLVHQYWYTKLVNLETNIMVLHATILVHNKWWD